MTRTRIAKRGGLLLGLGAVATMIGLGLGLGGPETTSAVAGSGDAPANTTYRQPVAKVMDMGATATWAAPSSAPATTMAVPPIKAGG
jgi:hypothetical protein